jgi:hypothetical protein
MNDRSQINILNGYLDDMSGELEMWIRDKAAHVVKGFLTTGRRQFIITAPKRVAHYHDRDVPAEPALDICVTPIPILRFYPREAQLVVEAIIRDELEKLDNTSRTVKPPTQAG